MLLFALCVLPFGLAQDYNWKVRHISVDEGLRNRFINCITQDSRGFMWVGTNFGLSRYDGYRIDVMTREENGLHSNTIYGLHPDQNGMLWTVHREARIAAVSKVELVDPVSFEVKSLDDYLPGNPFKNKTIINVVSGLHNTVFIIIGQNELYRFDSTGLHSVLPSDFNRGIRTIRYIDDTILFQNNSFDTVEQWTLDGRHLGSFAVPPFYKPHTSEINYTYIGKTSNGERVFELFESEQQYYGVYVLTASGQFIKKLAFEVRDIASTQPACFWDDYRKSIWIQSGEKFFNYNTSTGEIIYPDSTRSWEISSCYVTRDGQVWKGTQDGIYIFRSQPDFFNTVALTPEILFSTRGITKDTNGIVYALTHSGNLKYYPEEKRYEDWNFPDNITFVGIAMLTDHEGYIWITEQNGELYRFNPYENSYVRFVPVTNGYYATWSLAQLSNNELAMGSTQGLWIKDMRDKAAPVLFRRPNPNGLLDSSTVMHIVENEEGLWLATSNGLFLIDLKEGVRSHFNEASSGLPNNNLLFIHIDKEGTFWLGSRGGGLIRWDRKKNSFQSISTKEGLSNNVIYAVYEDDYGFLWLPSDFGLMRYEKETGICRTFLPGDGINHEEFNRASHYKDKEGNFYFGGLKGFLYFNPRNIREAAVTEHPFLLTRLEVLNGASGNMEDWTGKVQRDGRITLQSNMKSFLLHFAILDYDDSRTKRYAYKIVGLDNNWNYIAENFIRINGLGGGNYQLHLKAQKVSGEWTENEIVIPIRVLRPFLFRPATLIGLAMLIAAISIFLFRRRIALHQRKLEREKEISRQLRHVDKLKDQFLANTSHELRTPLHGIVGLSESLLEQAPEGKMQEDLELIISSGKRLSNLVNDILDFSRLKKHDLQLSKKPVDIHSMGNMLIRLNKPLLQGKEIVLYNQIPKSLPFCYADENRLQQILQNLIGNAIKFTHHGNITLSGKQEGNINLIEVSDTGIGIERDKQDVIFKAFEQADGTIAREYGGSGLGLSITKHLVQLHGGDMHLVSVPGKGSTFSFTIPVYEGQVEKSAMADIPFLEDDFDEPSLIQPVTRSETKANSLGHEDHKHHILIVDDEPVNLKVLKNYLEKEGYRVSMAQNGFEALHMLENDRSFHLVLLDVMMPRMPGYEVCQKIREKYMLTELPVIMVTAKNQVNDLVEGLGFGANDYINKPFSKDELIARVKIQLLQFDIQEATGRFVPHEFITSLGRQGITDLISGDMVERHVHVMFSDIRDYTSLAEDMSPRENFQFVNSLAGKVGPIVKRNDGIINQYLGDTIMMLYLQKADDGVQAGIEILQLIEGYNIQREKANRKLLKLGIGLHSGSLMMGIIGDQHHTEAAVISDTVNTASRMEGLTKFYNVNFIISEDTYQKIENPGRFNLRYLGKVQAKGKYNSIGIYECFNADPEKQRLLKEKTLSSFNRAMTAYYEADFEVALNHFEDVYHQNPADRTAFTFIHRVHGLIESGVPADWTGVEMMSLK